MPEDSKRFESYPDRLVREAMERGDFAHNPLHGKHIPLGRAGQNKPWIVERLEHEDLSGIVPEPVLLRREKQALATTLADVPTEAEAREIIEALNERIRRQTMNPTTGPRIVVSLVDVESAIRTWQSDHRRLPPHQRRSTP